MELDYIETTTETVIAQDGIEIDGRFTTRYYHVTVVNNRVGEKIECDTLYPTKAISKALAYWR